MCNASVMMLGQCESIIKSTSFFDTVELYGKLRYVVPK